MKILVFLESNFEYEIPVDIKLFSSWMAARTGKTCRDTILFKPKLRTYMKYKIPLFGTEEYVKYRMSRKQRCILAQFRTGTLPPKIETGHWQNLPIPERVCLVCAEDAVKDEKITGEEWQ